MVPRLLVAPGSRRVEDDGRVGYLVLEEEPGKLVEERVEIMPAAQCGSTCNRTT
jgi:hypothetical protein